MSPQLPAGAAALGLGINIRSLAKVSAPMWIGVGREGSNPHFAWRIGGEYRHALAICEPPFVEVTEAAARSFWQARIAGSVRQVPLPVLSSSRALQEGLQYRNCFFAAVGAFNRGNYYLPAIGAGGAAVGGAGYIIYRVAAPE